MSKMYVIVNVPQGSEMTDLMVTLASRGLTFSVTSEICKICPKCVQRDETPICSQALTFSNSLPPHTLKSVSQRQLMPRKIPPKTVPVRLAPLPEPTNIVNTALTREEEERVKKLRAWENNGHKRKESDVSSPGVSSQVEHTMTTIERMFADVKQEPECDSGETTTQSTLYSALNESGYNEVEMDNEPGELTVAEMKETIDKAYNLQPSFDKEMGKWMEHRGECKLCQMPISTRSHHIRRHALKHLGYKTFLCVVCSKRFNRADLCKPHFERYHPDMKQIPFKDVITDEQYHNLEEMVRSCFPNDYRPLKPPNTNDYA